MLSSHLPLLCSGLAYEEDLLLGLGLLILTPSAAAQFGGGSGLISFCAITVTVLPQYLTADIYPQNAELRSAG